MRGALQKLHLAGIVGALTTAIGLISLPEVTGLLPPKTAAIVIAVGAVIQGLTRAVHKGDVREVPKTDPSDLSMLP
jgi:hypothetical protein